MEEEHGKHSDKAKEKYRGMFEIQKSGDKTSSGEIGLDIRTHASPKVGQDQVSGGVANYVLNIRAYLPLISQCIFKTSTVLFYLYCLHI